jgi:hypothetical protein
MHYRLDHIRRTAATRLGPGRRESLVAVTAIVIEFRSTKPLLATEPSPTAMASRPAILENLTIAEFQP